MPSGISSSTHRTAETPQEADLKVRGPSKQHASPASMRSDNALEWRMPPIGAILFGIALIIDGDTLLIDGDRLRLQGIDAPELQQECMRNEQSYDCGTEAAQFLREMLAGRKVICMVRANEDDVALATCEGDGRDVAAAMLESGWAFATPRSGRRNAALEQTARESRLGLWAGTAEPPWLWRMRRHQ